MKALLSKSYSFNVIALKSYAFNIIAACCVHPF
jgi:hypothetical protein